MPQDGLPVVGQGPVQGLWLAVMHSGATLAPVVAELLAAEIMGGIYFEILQRIERRGFDVFTEVIRLPKVVRARIALSIWARGQLSALGYRLFSRA